MNELVQYTRHDMYSEYCVGENLYLTKDGTLTNKAFDDSKAVGVITNIENQEYMAETEMHVSTRTMTVAFFDSGTVKIANADFAGIKPIKDKVKKTQAVTLSVTSDGRIEAKYKTHLEEHLSDALEIEHLQNKMVLLCVTGDYQNFEKGVEYFGFEKYNEYEVEDMYGIKRLMQKNQFDFVRKV